MEDTSTEDLNDTIQSTNVTQKPTTFPYECKICGAVALHSYVGVIVCSSCKMFFKRNAETKQDHLKCPFHGHCDINILNRHICSSCRLAKCFTSGMQIEMLRSSRPTTSNTSHKRKMTTTPTLSVAWKERDQLQHLPTLNLLQSDQSTLSIDQWNLLSNLTHCYDEYNGFSLTQRYLREQNDLPLKMRFKLASVGELFASITGGGQLLFEKNSDFISLCSHDRSILLHNTMKYVAGLGSCLITRYTGLFDNAALYRSAELIYGSSALAINIRTIDQLDFDSTFIKLVLALLTFSTFHYTYYTNMAPNNLMNIKTILHIQDTYTELAWRYLIYKYDHERSVICFSNLIRCLFLLNDSLVEAAESKQYTNMIDSIVKQTEETFTLTR